MEFFGKGSPSAPIISWTVSLIESLLFRRDCSFLYASATRLITWQSFSFMYIIIFLPSIGFSTARRKKNTKNKPKAGHMIDVLVRNYYVLLTSYFCLYFDFYIYKFLTINLMTSSKMFDFSLLREPLVTTVTISIVYKILLFKSITPFSQKFHKFPL